MLAAAAAFGGGLRAVEERNQAAAIKNRPRAEEIFNDLLQRAQKVDEDKAKLRPGELAELHGGQNAMKGAIDLGDKAAVYTLSELDPVTLTAPCCLDGAPPLVYLRKERSSSGGKGSSSSGGGGGGSHHRHPLPAPAAATAHGGGFETEAGVGLEEGAVHPHAEAMVPFIEGLALAQGYVPFADGCLLPVRVLLEVLDPASNETDDDDDNQSDHDHDDDNDDDDGNDGNQSEHRDIETNDVRDGDGGGGGGKGCSGSSGGGGGGTESGGKLSRNYRGGSKGGRRRRSCCGGGRGELLTEKLRRGEIDYRQFKTLKMLQAFPRGFEKQNLNLAFLIECAQARRNPDGVTEDDIGVGDISNEKEVGQCAIN